MSKTSKLLDAGNQESAAMRKSSRTATKETDESPAFLKELNENRLVSDLRDMIAIPSINPFDTEPRPGFREKELAEFYCGRMAEIGLEVSAHYAAPGRPNVWGIFRGQGDGPSLMLSGHLDTVGCENYPDALIPRVAEGRVYGRGSCDMKAALAAYLEVARLLKESGIGLKGDLIITGLADEEHAMIGSRYLGRNGPWADYGIIGEPSDLMVCPAHKGQIGYRIRAYGKAAHSSKPEEGINAIEAMAQVIEALRAYGSDLKEREAHPLCGHGRHCPSVIRGGTILSTVPEFCELDVDRRTLPGESKEDVLSEYQALLDGIMKSSPAFRFEISGPTMEVPPLDIGIESPIVAAVMGAYRQVFGADGPISAFFAGSDAPNFGFPTLICGPGSVAQAHSTDEYVEIDDLIAATKLYLCTALAVLAAD
jgi:acetylornithine deacetylase